MRYLLMICTDGPLDADPAKLNVGDWIAATTASGTRVTGDRLRPPGDATTVRLRDGEVLLTDGPFAETKEQVGGFDIIECPDLDAAIEVAAAHPIARFGAVEIRPIWEMRPGG